MKYLHYILLAMAATLLAACSDTKSIKIEGSIEGNPSMNIYVMYYADGSVHQGVIAAAQGKFAFKVASARPMLITLMDNEYHIIGLVYAKGGDKVDMKVDRANPYKVSASGSEIMEQWTVAMAPIADRMRNASPAERNALIEEYIAQNPASKVSSLLMANFYDASIDPIHAAEVMASIADEGVIPGMLDALATMNLRYAQNPERIGKMRFRTLTDSLVVYDPAKTPLTLMTFSNDRQYRADSLVPRLKDLRRRYKPAKLDILDFQLATDTFSWKRTIKPDSATWTQPWVPGGLLSVALDPLAIPALPYIIVADSAGNTLYRGSSLDLAKKTIENP